MLFIPQGHKGVKGEAGEPGKQGHMVRTRLSLVSFYLCSINGDRPITECDFAPL